MKVFQSLQKSMLALGVKSSEPAQQNTFNVISIVPFLFFARYILFAPFGADTFNEYAEAWYGGLSSALTGINLLIFILKMRKFFDLISNFESIIQQRQANPASKHIYEKTNEDIEKCTNIIYVALMKVTRPGVILPNMIISYFDYFTTDLDDDAFRLPFPEWFPFNFKTKSGYLIACCFQAVTAHYITYILASNSSFLYGSCQMLKSLAIDIKKEWNATKELGKSKDSHVEFSKRLNEYIKFHAAAKQLVLDFTDINEFIVTAYFLWGLLTVCGSLLLVQIELQNDISIELIKPFLLMCWSIFLIFLFCELGESISNQFYELNDALYQSDWYSFPADAQRMLPMLLMATQQQVVPRGFGNLLCIRGSFQNIINSGFSYYLVLRRFDI